MLNPGGAVATDGSMHLFPRYVDDQNLSRIGHVRVLTMNDAPYAVERCGIALEPSGKDEAGGCEDARVTYVPLLKRYVMTYVAVGACGPRIGLAVSDDLYRWDRLGIVRYAVEGNELDLNICSAKDAAFFSQVVFDSEGAPSFGIMHRPTVGLALPEQIWLSYVPVEAVLDDLKQSDKHEAASGDVCA